MKQTNPSEKQQPKLAELHILDWVIQAKAGDRTAFHQLVDRFQPEIFRMIYYRTRSQMDSEDLTQDVFLQAYKHLGRLQSPEVFKSWLYSIAVNKVRDYHRKKRFRSLFGGGSTDDEAFYETEKMAVAPEAEQQVARKDFWRQVGKAMERLSVMEQEVFTLRFFDQLSIKEITATLKKNESTIKTHLYRGMNKVKDHFGDMQRIMEEL
ncbi:MAG: RNA polymerase sigma factor [Desulfobacteraceae bacterium]|nr:RNA polymerase sigma factor [Desulfobacteraceae bacterium]